MIGIYDLELENRKESHLPIPSLEAQKLYHYYKTEGEFSRLILPEENQDITSYDKIYVCSNFIEKVPSFLLGARELEFVGSPFGKNKKYEGFENELIDYSTPKAELYKNFLRQQFQNGVKAKEINDFLDACYYRIELNGEKLIPSLIHKRKKVYIYDDEPLKISNWQNAFQSIGEHSPSGIYFLHPLICKNPQDFYDLRKIEKVGRTNEIHLDFDVAPSKLLNFVKENEYKMRAEIVASSNICIPFGAREGVYNTTIAYYRELIRALNILYTYWSHSVQVKLKYIPPKIGEKNKIEDLFLVVENFSNLTTKKRMEKSIYNLIYLKDKKRREEKIEWCQYKDFLKYYPTLNNLFLQNYNNLSERRYWDFANQ